jgi:hypothetical protein
MGLLNLTPPVLGQQNSVADAATANAFTTIQTWANGNVDETNFANATVQRMGLNNSGNVGRGKSIIPTSEGRTNVAFGLMPTPDQVTGIVVPQDGVVAVLYQATWNESVDASAQAAIFVDGASARIAQGNVAAPIAVSASCSGGAGIDVPLSTGPAGLMGIAGAGGVAYTGDVTAGQFVGNATFESATAGGTGAPSANAPMGGPAYLFMAAGTHTISVQFLASSGTVTVKNRKLWVWTIGF